MERPIGEVFTLDRNEFKVIESKDEFCFDCYFYKGEPNCSDSIVRETIGVCEDSKRSDLKNIVFIKVE